MNEIVLGGGCFWCMEAVFLEFAGVHEVTPGYAGGALEHPTYDDVCAGRGGHAEVIKVVYDPAVIPLDTLLEIFWTVHDPTTLNRQGHDEGIQYRSCIYYTTDLELHTIETVRERMQSLWTNPIVTEIAPLTTFYEAEDYHKNYFANNPDKAYCQVVINPKLHDARKKFQTLLR